MKYSTRLSDAVHILAFIALYPDCDLTSNKLAESIQTNPAYVRQLMSALRKGGLLVSVKGHPRPALAREPEKITLLDAYRAVEGNKPLLHQDIHTNPACASFLFGFRRFAERQGLLHPHHNQDTQFVKLYPEEKVAEIQGDHRFFQCAACCTKRWICSLYGSGFL